MHHVDHLLGIHPTHRPVIHIGDLQQRVPPHLVGFAFANHHLAHPPIALTSRLLHHHKLPRPDPKKPGRSMNDVVGGPRPSRAISAH